MKRYLIKFFNNNNYVKINFNKNNFGSCKKEEATRFITFEQANNYKLNLEKFYKNMKIHEKFIIEEV